MEINRNLRVPLTNQLNSKLNTDSPPGLLAGDFFTRTGNDGKPLTRNQALDILSAALQRANKIIFRPKGSSVLDGLIFVLREPRGKSRRSRSSRRQSS